MQSQWWLQGGFWGTWKLVTPSGQTTNNTVKGSQMVIATGMRMNKSSVWIYMRACDDLYHGYHVLSYNTDKIEVKQLMMEQRYNIIPGIIVTESCTTVNKEKMYAADNFKI